MDTKHTPGPWRYVRANPSPTTGEHLISGARPGYLAEVRDCGSGDVSANAALIAAAPEMLAALQEFVAARKMIGWKEGECDLWLGSAWHHACDAIAKATES